MLFQDLNVFNENFWVAFSPKKIPKGYAPRPGNYFFPNWKHKNGALGSQNVFQAGNIHESEGVSL